MMRSASGTYSLPAACMKSYWVSTSQKITRGMARNLFDCTGMCQRQSRRVSRNRDRRLQTQHDGDLVAAVLPGTARAIRPHLERKLLALGGHKAELHEERGLARQGEHLVQLLRTRFGGERLEQGPPHSRSLPACMHGETGDLGEPTRIDLQGAASHDLAVGGRGDGVLLDVPAQVVVAARQQIAGGDVGGHERLEGRDVGEHRAPHRDAGQRYGKCAHARISSSTAAPRSSSTSVTTRGGIRRTTLGPAVARSSRRSRATATNGAAGSFSSTPHSKPRPRTSATRVPRAASRASRPPRHSPLRRTSARNSGAAIVRTTSRATPATSGPPPKVVACSPGLSAAATAPVS